MSALVLLLLQEQAQAARFEAIEHRFEEHRTVQPERRGPAVAPGNRYAMRDEEKAAMTAQPGQERLRHPPGFMPAR